MNPNPLKNYNKKSLKNISVSAGGGITAGYLSQIRCGRKKLNALQAVLIEIGTDGDILVEEWGLKFFDDLKKIGFARSKRKLNPMKKRIQEKKSI